MCVWRKRPKLKCSEENQGDQGFSKLKEVIKVSDHSCFLLSCSLRVVLGALRNPRSPRRRIELQKWLNTK